LDISVSQLNPGHAIISDFFKIIFYTALHSTFRWP
jgi:hypothetical protein